MRKCSPLLLPCLCILLLMPAALPQAFAAQIEGDGAIEGFVDVNGVRLQYLDWGGSGPALVLVHGMADNPHVFDDLAPAFTDRFRVVAYARRGSGSSEVKGPYDIRTLTEDLHGVLDALRIRRADLVGYSAGGDDVTSFAAEYPDRVNRIVYLDSAYDFSGSDFRAVLNAYPINPFDRPASAMSSVDAYLAYARANFYPELDDAGMKRINANLLAKVVVQSDGSVKDRTPKSVTDALIVAQQTNQRRQYTRLGCPALAIYSESLFDLHIADPQRRKEVLAFEQQYWQPFQAKSMERARREIANIEIVKVSGAHGNFPLTDRPQLVELMRRFLEVPMQTAQAAKREP